MEMIKGWCDGCRYFFFNDTATTEIYTLSLHDALPISTARRDTGGGVAVRAGRRARGALPGYVDADPDQRPRNRVAHLDRKSTRLNSSHSQMSYAVVCLKKKILELCSNWLDSVDTVPSL